MANTINLVKLCVGAESVEDLQTWQTQRLAQSPDVPLRHVTRMWPKRDAELLNGGSLYWVIKGVVQARQGIVRLDEVIGEDGIRRCGLVLDPKIQRTETVPKRPFQGWRYLTPEDAPRDLAQRREGDDTLPASLIAALSEIGLR